jgi:hypothetical protein
MSESIMDDKKDFWGAPFDDDPYDPQDSAPAALLRIQADFLTQRTGGRVKGVVLQDIDQASVWASLYASVPALEDYMHKLLTVAHPISDDPRNPSLLGARSTFSGNDNIVNIEGMENFGRWLEAELSSPTAHAIISNLLKYGSDRAAS